MINLVNLYRVVSVRLNHLHDLSILLDPPLDSSLLFIKFSEEPVLHLNHDV
jgi:hypothetical protein